MSEARTCEDCQARPARRHRRKCNTCRAAAWDKAHPWHREWRNIYISAAKRGIFCALSLSHFQEVMNDAPEYGGWHAEAITIDRIRPRLGYVDGNIGLKTRSANSAKHWTDSRAPQPF